MGRRPCVSSCRWSGWDSGPESTHVYRRPVVGAVGRSGLALRLLVAQEKEGGFPGWVRGQGRLLEVGRGSWNVVQACPLCDLLEICHPGEFLCG
jgi:hypothetical protein